MSCLGQSISLPVSQRNANHLFNTAAFSDPAPFTFGDAGRDIIPGRGMRLSTSRCIAGSS